MTAMLATRAGWELEEADNVARACAIGAHVRPPVMHASTRRHRLAPSASIAPAGISHAVVGEEGKRGKFGKYRRR
ncbi:hypothetical protein WME88_35575 [Sorangium sp. So ce216]